MPGLLAEVAALDQQRGSLFCWVPVCLAVGIGIFFALPGEPSVAALWALGAAAVGVAVVLRRWLAAFPLIVAVPLVLAGMAIAGARAHMVADPVLDFRYYGPVTGRIVKIDRSASDAVRLTLDNVVLRDMSPERTPGRVRVSLHGEQGWVRPEPGLAVVMTAHLSPPPGPAEPGGFNFQRQAWFDGLGAVGYTRVPVLTLARVPPGVGRATLARVRIRMATAIRQALPGERGAFAATIMTGDRSGMGAETLAALRASNLAHLLAISGLHMGLLTGFVFLAVRLALALVPGWALRFPIKAWAAGAALAAGVVYLALSGGNVATQRAFIMVSVMLLAVILGRRALTLRAVALAAVVVLLLAPESLTEPGFQMSFAATTALVAAFRLLRDTPMASMPKWLQPVIATVISSAVAGAATAPIAAAHFNTIAQFGLVANLLSVPLMGLVVMPLAVLTAVLSLVGLGAWGLWAMSPAIGWILGVAHWVAGLDDAVGRVPAPPGAELPLLAFGLLATILWQGRARWLGIAPAVASIVLWAQVERPPLLISESGGLMGVMTEAGRAISKPRGDGFAAASWLENDGDAAGQPAAAARVAFHESDLRIQLQFQGRRITHLRGKSGPSRVAEACAEADLVVLAGRSEAREGCEVVDWQVLRRTGALAVYPEDEGLRIVAARSVSGHRLWTGNTD